VKSLVSHSSDESDAQDVFSELSILASLESLKKGFIKRRECARIARRSYIERCGRFVGNGRLVRVKNGRRDRKAKMNRDTTTLKAKMLS
jgi:hypothetical protein